MALRAGYYGVKRKIYENLQDDVKNLKISSYPYSVAGEMGTRNMLENTLTSGTTHMVVSTVNADGSISLTGTADANTTKNLNSYTGAQVKTLGSKLKLTGGISSNVYLAFRSSDWTLNIKDLGDGVVVDTTSLADATTYYVSLVISNGTKTDGIVIYPMLKNINDTSNVWASYAMTNHQLTESADDQKTAINAIITAATGAADFAAFKTAMAAITPVTRSAGSDERSLEVEEPVEVKKTTRKTTKKTEEEE